MEAKIRDIIIDAMQLPDSIWDFYICLKDKKKYDIDYLDLMSIIKKSTACGQECARMIRQKYDGISIHEFTKDQNVDVVYTDQIRIGNKIVFAIYEEPKTIKISSGLLEDAKNLVIAEHLEDVIDPSMIEDVLLAHEIYHVLESASEENIYTRNCHIFTRRWLFKMRVMLPFASELGAMAFAEEWLGLSYHPGVLDILLTEVIDPSFASGIYKDVKLLQRSSITEPTA